jgi:hypothetical protein
MKLLQNHNLHFSLPSIETFTARGLVNHGLSLFHSKPQRRLQVSRKLREGFRLRRIRASDNGRFAGICVGADLCVQRDVS